ncbi:MAG: hypothetical protein JRN58_09875 [Nitrososphaerota archaeon]|nr:hypothetical protein [Nitrososphaerota archaeon]
MVRLLARWRERFDHWLAGIGGKHRRLKLALLLALDAAAMFFVLVLLAAWIAAGVALL